MPKSAASAQRCTSASILMPFRHMQATAGAQYLPDPQDMCDRRIILTAVLHDVPRLLELMPPETKQALSVSSKSLHKQMCAFATTVSITTHRGLDYLLTL